MTFTSLRPSTAPVDRHAGVEERMSPGARFEPWHVVARHGSWRVADGVLERVPNGVTHAKKIGTSITACGETSVSWQVFWALTFPVKPGAGSGSCVACATAVLAVERARHRPA